MALSFFSCMTAAVNESTIEGDGKPGRKRSDNKEFHFVYVKFEGPVRTRQDLELKRTLGSKYIVSHF